MFLCLRLLKFAWLLVFFKKLKRWKLITSCYNSCPRVSTQTKHFNYFKLALYIHRLRLSRTFLTTGSGFTSRRKKVSFCRFAITSVLHLQEWFAWKLTLFWTLWLFSGLYKILLQPKMQKSRIPHFRYTQ